MGHSWRRCSSRAHTSGRDKRKSSKAWSWRETYPMKTPTWQLSTLPRWLHHCRFTPIECVPRFGKLLRSKAMIPWRGADELLQDQALNIDEGGDLLSILAWQVGQQPLEIEVHVALAGFRLKRV